MLETEFAEQFAQRMTQRRDELQRRLDEAGLTVAQRELSARECRKLEAALQRLRQGGFGVCCDCGEKLSMARLDEDPATPFCEDCSEERKAA